MSTPRQERKLGSLISWLDASQASKILKAHPHMSYDVCPSKPKSACHKATTKCHHGSLNLSRRTSSWLPSGRNDPTKASRSKEWSESSIGLKIQRHSVSLTFAFLPKLMIQTRPLGPGFAVTIIVAACHCCVTSALVCSWACSMGIFEVPIQSLSDEQWAELMKRNWSIIQIQDHSWYIMIQDIEESQGP